MSAPDNLNCLKNLMQLMCCDGDIAPREKAFLRTAAAAMEVRVDDWNALLQEIVRDDVMFYPIERRDKAVAALKAVLVMAKADGRVDDREKRFARQFAKSIGLSKSDWQRVIGDIDAETLFAPFQQKTGELIAVTEDFDAMDAFVRVAADNQVTVRTMPLKACLQAAGDQPGVVCFHAAADTGVTVARARLLGNVAAEQLICVLTRFQGLQVKYLHEAGLKKCIIEPVYTRDIVDIFKSGNNA